MLAVVSCLVQLGSQALKLLAENAGLSLHKKLDRDDDSGELDGGSVGTSRAKKKVRVLSNSCSLRLISDG